jgi:hypothetical protein
VIFQEIKIFSFVCVVAWLLLFFFSLFAQQPTEPRSPSLLSFPFSSSKFETLKMAKLNEYDSEKVFIPSIIKNAMQSYNSEALLPPNHTLVPLSDDIIILHHVSIYTHESIAIMDCIFGTQTIQGQKEKHRRDK